MKKSILPKRIDIFRLSEQAQSLSGEVDIMNMERLRSPVVHLNEAQYAKVTLQFGIDEQGIIYIQGHLEVSLTLQCQRCLEPFVYEIITDFTLGMVKTTQEASKLPDHFEPVLINDRELSLYELIEDEIILHLPIVAKHELNECSIELPKSSHNDSNEEAIQQASSPFSQLVSLKKRKIQ